MSEIVREPSDAEFAALLDLAAPNRLGVENAEESPAEPAPVVPEEPEAEVPAEPVALPEKYQGKTVEEIVQMHQAAEQLLGRQGQELGEARQLRAELDELKGTIDTLQNQPAPVTQETVDWLEQSVLTNPRETMDWVLKNQPQLYDRAMQSWADLDPFGALRFDTAYILAQERQAIAQELAAVRQPVQQSQSDAVLQQAYSAVVAANPQFAQVAESLPALLEENPWFKPVLANGDLASRQQALTSLMHIAQGSGAVGTPAVETPAPPAPDTRAAKVAATTVSASGTPGSGESLNPLDEWKANFVKGEGTSVADELARNRAAHGR